MASGVRCFSCRRVPDLLSVSGMVSVGDGTQGAYDVSPSLWEIHFVFLLGLEGGVMR